MAKHLSQAIQASQVSEQEAISSIPGITILGDSDQRSSASKGSKGEAKEAFLITTAPSGLGSGAKGSQWFNLKQWVYTTSAKGSKQWAAVHPRDIISFQDILTPEGAKAQLLHFKASPSSALIQAILPFTGATPEEALSKAQGEAYQAFTGESLKAAVKG